MHKRVIFSTDNPVIAETKTPPLLCGHMGWFSDFFRLAWGFLYWNTRKTVYRLRGTRGQCPCQHPSDSGRAWETGCAAMIHWHSPARFRRLCPLLQKNEAGLWRCSVDSREVRPFWGRAVAFYGTAVATVYLMATLGVFIFMRTVGYPVSYAGVLWPPAWEKFTAIRAGFFLEKYRAASAAGDMQSALMSLSTAYSLDRSNYAAGRKLAQLWQVSLPGASNQIYHQLLNEHPAEAEATAQTWFRALLARGDFVGVEQLAFVRIAASSDHLDAWLTAFLFANQRTGDADTRRRLQTTASLPAPARFLLNLTGDLEKASPSEARERLLRAAAGAGDAVSFFNVCRQLIVRGFAQDALQWIDRRPGLIGPRDRISLRLDALASLGWGAPLRSEVENLLVATPDPVIVELLSAHLIRHPDPVVRTLVFDRIEKVSLPDTQASYPAYLSLFCAAGAGRDAPRLQWAAARIRETLHSDFRSLDPIGESLLDGNRNRRIENYLPALQPLPLEVSYALFEHYAPVSP